jgi:hypothetical protein
MSGIKSRHFYNNIANFDDCRYLEIGSYKGSTACAALCNNKIKLFYCIDNWCEYENNKDEFLNNIYNYLENDCFTYDLTNFKVKLNVYMYDGNSSYKSLYKALEYYYDVLENKFIYIVNDWTTDDIKCYKRFKSKNYS